MSYYPSEQWLEAYGRVLDESEALDDLAVGWGDGFDGDITFVIEDVPLAETRLADLPDELLEDLPADVRSSFADVTLAEAPAMFGDSVRSTLPDHVASLLDQIERNVVDGNLYVYVSLEGGDCNAVELLEGPDERETGFAIRGDYDAWRQVVDGRPPASALISGDLTVEGSPFHQLRYSAMLQLLGELAADVETTHLFPGERRTSADLVLDQAVRQPAVLQRTAERQLTRTLSLF